MAPILMQVNAKDLKITLKFLYDLIFFFFSFPILLSYPDRLIFQYVCQGSYLMGFSLFFSHSGIFSPEIFIQLTTHHALQVFIETILIRSILQTQFKLSPLQSRHTLLCPIFFQCTYQLLTYNIIIFFIVFSLT